MRPVLCDRGHTPKELQGVATLPCHATRCNSCLDCPIGCVLAHMTQTLEPTDTVTPQQRVDAWLADFEAALAVRDIDRAVQKFATDSFWRDLVAFTWNIKTIEGRDEIADMLHARLAEHRPVGLRNPRDSHPGRRCDVGVHRVRDRRRPRRRASAPEGRSGLDVADRTAGAQGPRGAKGYDARAGRRARQRPRPAVVGREARRRGRDAGLQRCSRTCSSSAAGRAASRSARGCANSACPRSSSTSTNGRATSGASATSRCACTTRSGTTTCPTCRSRRTGRCSRPRTRSATGWSSTPG